ncbi:unnamed protein product [Colias eurytheme]|nr:unnamed protein product [Colias eurytheme]
MQSLKPICYAVTYIVRAVDNLRAGSKTASDETGPEGIGETTDEHLKRLEIGVTKYFLSELVEQFSWV